MKSLFDAGKKVHTEIWLDNEVHAGNFFSTLDYQLSSQLSRPRYVDLEWDVDTGSHHQIRQALFRAFATAYLGQTAITVGRQRIAWGTGFAWNPTDLFNPFNPSAIELEEKEGIDAMHAALPIGELSKIEVAYAPGADSFKDSYAARMTANYREYDVAIMAGQFKEDWVLGGDFAGYLGDAGFRGEFAYTFKDGQGNFLRAILNADYNFPHDIYAMVEIYYNGQGAWDKKDYNLTSLLAGDTFNLARLYTAVSATKTITSLFNGSAYGLVNLNDGSMLIGPNLQYSLAENLEISASTYLLLGSDDSEFGQYQTSYFGAIQWFF